MLWLRRLNETFWADVCALHASEMKSEPTKRRRGLMFLLTRRLPEINLPVDAAIMHSLWPLGRFISSSLPALPDDHL